MTLSSSDTSIFFTSCGPISTLAPGVADSSSCTVRKAVLQSDFDAREAGGAPLGFTLDIAASSTVTDMTVTKDSPAATKTGLELTVTRQMTITTSLDKTAVAATGELWFVKLPPCVCLCAEVWTSAPGTCRLSVKLQVRAELKAQKSEW